MVEKCELVRMVRFHVRIHRCPPPVTKQQRESKTKEAPKFLRTETIPVFLGASNGAPVSPRGKKTPVPECEPRESVCWFVRGFCNGG